MVPWSTVIFSLLSFVLAVFVPFIAAIWFCRKYKVPFTTVLVGALTFFVVQVVLRIPMLQFLGFDSTMPGGFFAYSAFLAITAALFEELGRLGFFKLFRRNPNWENAVAFGIGHGGIEAILLVGFTMAVNSIFLVMLALDVPLELPPETLAALTETSPFMFLLGGIERLLVLPVHVAFSILVVAGIARRQYGYIGMAIFAHFLLNLPIGWMVETFGYVVTELYILLWSGAAWFFIIRSRIQLFARHDE